MNPTVPYPDFVGLDLAPPEPENARYHIIPVPCEKTVSYGGGTARGPRAILEASLQLELFDGVDIPAEAGIYTHPPVDCSGDMPRVLDNISQAVSKVLTLGKIPVLLGGEHSITFGAVRELNRRKHALGVVQFDAHADLRDTYQEDPFSHACAMRRILDMNLPLFQIGNRSMSQPEYQLRQKIQIGHLDAREIAGHGIPADVLPQDFPDDIYISFDVDVFDPSIVPATGTPEPGGLLWYDVLNLLRSILAGRRVIGMDFVELAPIAGMPAPDFAVARLIYNLFGMINRSPCTADRTNA